MDKKDLRLVEFTVVEKTSAGKGKKAKKEEVKKYGYFHLWGTNVNGKGNEKFFALIEDEQNGGLYEVAHKDIRFLSDAEAEAKLKGAEAPAETATVVAEVAPVVAEALEEIAPEAAAPVKPQSKPRAPRKTKA